ncbi:MAG: VirB3 family type IV secretion system protein [Synergistaceae bacterium]|jgi:type IV secretion system protein VirB3|nr:VirB3 family type IV secretion system protein [Synergistaceae bacterium]
MAEEKVRQISINQSMTKPLLILGCDRDLFALSSLMCGYVGFSLGITRAEFSVALFAGGAWILIHFGLRLMGKADPRMREVFQRSTQYSDRPFHNQFHIPARSPVKTEIPAFVRRRWF